MASKRPPLYLNGQPVAPQPRQHQEPPTPPIRPGCNPPCCGIPGAGDGGHDPDCAWRPKPKRVFDHLTGLPEDAKFNRAANAMRRGVLRRDQYGPVAWWQKVPEYFEPVAVSGEIDR